MFCPAPLGRRMTVNLPPRLPTPQKRPHYPFCLVVQDSFLTTLSILHGKFTPLPNFLSESLPRAQLHTTPLTKAYSPNPQIASPGLPPIWGHLILTEHLSEPHGSVSLISHRNRKGFKDGPLPHLRKKQTQTWRLQDIEGHLAALCSRSHPCPLGGGNSWV